MPNLRLFTSNRLEILADELAKVTGIPLSSPFDREVIVVQSRGMERWISMELALRHGVSANIEFPFPNAFINDVLKRAFPGLIGQPYFNPEIMTWRIMEILPSLVS
ncbi:MAG: exodeoxyribonuclease V subunit gamma, partial [Deltaproteobacteria bacterium]|nr:exodeoxyribonuclease V subunit gamma [Deltaproteobacteria bacterium]